MLNLTYQVMKHFRANGLSLLAVLLTLVLNSFSMSAADKVTVTGKITSTTDGEPLVGVAVFIPGTNYSAFSDINGDGHSTGSGTIKEGIFR